MSVWRSPAKINWWLRVLDRRPDGFHDIETVFQEIALHDTLELDALPGRDECLIEGMPGGVETRSNLIWRAWDALRSEYPDRVGGAVVHVTKRIPMGGGLGGGSSNAATTLKALADLYSLPATSDDLRAVASRLGSDTAFFIRGGCQVGRGRGELLEPVAAPAHPVGLVLVFPSQGVSTAWAYAELSRRGRPSPPMSLPEFLRILGPAEPAALAGAVHNDFEVVVSGLPWFGEAREALLRAGCTTAFLSGSGSTVVGVVPKEKNSREIARTLQESLRLKVEATVSKRPEGG